MKIMLSAGEVSGDVHGAYLVRELKKLRPDIYFFGMGSEKLAAEGVDIKFDISKRGTIGIFEALPNILPILSVFQKLKRLILSENPDLVILVDSQGINVPLAKFCKKAGIKTAYYIAPQEWLWGTPHGVKKVAESVDLLVAIFQKEYEAYKKAGANVVYFGHPLVDIVKSDSCLPAGTARLVTRDSRPIICLCPGSRTQEINCLLPIFLNAAELIQKEMPGASFIIPAASKEIYNKINTFICHLSFVICHLSVFDGNAYDALNSSDLAICASGTINLEASLLGVPNIMVYKLSPLTYWIGKHILKIGEKLKYFSMPNILLDEKVVPELIMGDARPGLVAQAALEIIKSPARQEKMRRAFQQLSSSLGSPGVIGRIARSLLSNI